MSSFFLKQNTTPHRHRDSSKLPHMVYEDVTRPHWVVISTHSAHSNLAKLCASARYCDPSGSLSVPSHTLLPRLQVLHPCPVPCSDFFSPMWINSNIRSFAETAGSTKRCRWQCDVASVHTCVRASPLLWYLSLCLRESRPTFYP